MAVLFTVRAGPDLGYAQVLPAGHYRIGRAGEVRLLDPTVARLAGELSIGARAVRVHLPGRASRRLRLRQRGCELTFGNTRVQLAPITPARLGTAIDGALALRVGIPLLMAVAMVPLALGGPPWRWAMVAIPAFMALAGWWAMRSATTRSARHQRLPDHPSDLLARALLGGHGVHVATLPRMLTRAVTLNAGEAWSLSGPHAEAHARYLAGWLALAHDRSVLALTCPWFSTPDPARGGVRLRIEEAARATAPGTDEVVITYGAPLPWAVPLPIRWGRSIPRASARFISEVAALHARHTPAQRLPEAVLAADLMALTPDAVAARWRRTALAPNLAVPLARAMEGPLLVDLVRDGPHAIVAGTTGAGKSELLTTWLLMLAATNPPTTLTFLLIDFKGGAAFGPLIRLPHTIGVLTDLEPAGTARALTSLRAQLRRRERLLAAAGLRSIDEYETSGCTPLMPRILVVIDEFAALTSDHPDVLDQFVRIATQGRSLGIHLIAATQRPAGAVSAQMRANMPLRICLRVTTPADSSDVIDRPDAADLPPIAGRAFVASTLAQIAWAGPLEDVRALVTQIDAAWRRTGGRGAQVPWAPELPRRIERAGPEAWGLADEPEELRHVPYRPTGRHVLIMGGPAAGKTTAALLATRLSARHTPTYLVADRARLASQLADLEAEPHFGGVIDLHEAHLARMLPEILGRDRRCTLVIDDLHAWRAALDSAFGPGFGADHCELVIRLAASVIATSDASLAAARYAAALSERLILGGLDPGTQAVCGLSSEQRMTRLIPGRARCLTSGRLIQLALAPSPHQTSSDPQVRRLRSLAEGPAPSLNHEEDTSRAAAGWCLPYGEPFTPQFGSTIVVGPAGSGRSAALAVLAAPWAGQAVVIDDATGEEAELAAAREEGRAVLLATTPARLNAATYGPLTDLKAEARILLLRPNRGPRLTGIGAVAAPWVYAADPTVDQPGRGVWLTQGGADIVALVPAP
ncbi:MAG: FtsK/SpoIIIE domain-containing protein [Bowdeniella nasicola]|nr:FtsK/SpoIIIE domain-containing protein [Bowdeniella nasicola]